MLEVRGDKAKQTYSLIKLGIRLFSKVKGIHKKWIKLTTFCPSLAFNQNSSFKSNPPILD